MNNHNNNFGSIHLILGPMYSGKTSELIKRYDRYTIAKRKALMIKYKNDTRYDQHDVITHTGTTVKSCVAERLGDLDHIVRDFEVICVDEVQFYQDAPLLCDKWANEGKIVICCGLNGNFKREPFPIISQLIPKAEEILFLTAICEESGQEAHFTFRTTAQTEDEIIGGKEMYMAVDRQTYFK